MNDNVVKFKKKFTLEQEQINYLKQHLDATLADANLLMGYITKPYLGSHRWRSVLDSSMLAATRTAVEWLVQDLTERDVTADERAFNIYSELIEWHKTTPLGHHFALTMYTETNETMQYVFLCVEERKLALVAIYDDNKDMVSGIVQVLNTQGMRNLGYGNEG